MGTEERKHRKNQIEILSSGYELHYGDLVEWFTSGFDRRSCREVLDILEMFSEITWALRDLTAEQKASLKPHAITFTGFDGNNESRPMAYARFSMFDLGRYESLHEQAKKTGMNSHCPMLPIYRRMLNVFQTLWGANS